MELPVELKAAIENGIEDVKHDTLLKNAEEISVRYQTKIAQGIHLITKEDEAVTYSIVRMPATYGAVYSALKYTLDLCKSDINSLIDAGAGTGAASWAADSLINLNKVTCLEREDVMIKTGKKLMLYNTEGLKNSEWKKCDLVKDSIEDKADLVIASYSLNELKDEERLSAADKLYDAAEKIFLIIEPGTMAGFSNLKKIREHFLNKGAHIIAPCPHEEQCSIDSWCHFTCRIPRSRLHKELKKGEVPYEDEKFAYLALSKVPNEKAEMRVLRHPVIKKGRVAIEACCKDGIKNVELFKKDKELYKQAKKAKWGDAIIR